MKGRFKILFVTLLLVKANCFSQTLKEDYGYENLDSVISFKTAVKDIETNKIKIFGQGGIAPVAYTKVDSVFEAKYKIRYVLFGCVSPYQSEDMQEYNQEIGKYLDKIYGKAWRKELHPDVIGLR